MLLKKNRAGKKDLTEVFERGKFLNSQLFTVKFLLKKDIFTPKIACVAPKNIAKLAVKRNALRRQGYLALGPNLKNLPNGFVGAFIFKKPPGNPAELQNDIETLINKIS